MNDVIPSDGNCFFIMQFWRGVEGVHYVNLAHALHICMWLWQNDQEGNLEVFWNGQNCSISQKQGEIGSWAMTKFTSAVIIEHLINIHIVNVVRKPIEIKEISFWSVI